MSTTHRSWFLRASVALCCIVALALPARVHGADGVSLTADANPIWLGETSTVTLVSTQTLIFYTEPECFIEVFDSDWNIVAGDGCEILYAEFDGTNQQVWIPGFADRYAASVSAGVATGGWVALSTNIDAISLTSDVDKEGLADAWEMTHFGHLGQGAFDNPDEDYLNNIEEQASMTDPMDPDSDDDGYLDGYGASPGGAKDAHIIEYSPLSECNTGGNTENEIGEYRHWLVDRKTWLLKPLMDGLRQPVDDEMVILQVYFDHERNSQGDRKEFGVYELLRVLRARLKLYSIPELFLYKSACFPTLWS